ncbi:unnamed protein product, partial [Rotaria magnacalcarata]
KKAHGSKHLGTQISYWIDLQTIMNTHPVNPPTVATINEIKWLDNRLDPYRTMLDQQIVLNAANLNSFNHSNVKVISFHILIQLANRYIMETLYSL